MISTIFRRFLSYQITMKKTIFLFLTLLLILACGTRKKSRNQSVGLKGFTSYYNTLFNSKDALETELKNREKAHKDNFFAPYISILTTEDAPLGSDIGNSGKGIFGDMQTGVPNAAAMQNTTALEISEAKAQKAIAKYSVMKNGEEKNKRMFEAHILLAQAQLYQNKPLDALNSLNYLFTAMQKDKRLDLAKIYQAQAYAKMGDYYRANEIFLSLDDLKKDYDKLKTIYYSEMLVASGKKEEAVAELENAFNANKSRKLRSRIAYLRGQVLASLGKKEEARESFTTAYKYANDFEFEVKSQLEIAKTFNSNADDYEGAKKYLEDISKKGTYASRKNELYYALGLLAKDAHKNDEAQAYFRRALAEKESDPQVRGLTYYEIGQNYFNSNDYIAAGAYYDSAVAVMSYQPAKEELSATASNIKKLTQNYYLIKKNDSVLALARMSATERDAYFTKYIDQLKAKEAKELALQRENERNNGFDTGDYNAQNALNGDTRAFQDFGNQSKGFYFANQSAISRGQSTFRQLWGTRSLQDNWRYSARTTSIQDVKNQTMGQTDVQDPRRFETEFYTEKIPTDASVLAQLKKDRDTATLGLARMYDAYFSNRQLATKTLYDLVDSQPESDVKLQALYTAFSINYEQEPSAAERAKTMILAEYPYTPYAEFVKNPKTTAFASSTSEVEAEYSKAFSLYSEGKYAESQKIVESALAKYPQDALAPKFTLLNAYNAGKTAGKEVMILQLQQLSLNYGRTPEGMRAKDMLTNLKSDLAPVQTTNADGSPAVSSQNMQQVPGQPVPAAVSSAYVQQTAEQPVPKINTTQNVVQPAANTVMPTSPAINPNQPAASPNPIRTGPPGTPANDTGVGIPAMSPQQQKRTNEVKIKNQP